MPNFDVYVIKLTSENVSTIVAEAAKFGWTLDHLQDNMECNAEYGQDTIQYMRLFKDTTDIADFNDVGVTSTNPMPELTDDLDPVFGIFHKI